MMIHYPAGIPAKKSPTRGAQPGSSQSVSFAKRGMSFEDEINATNDYYLSHEMAVVHKKPTPIQVVRVEYPQRSKAKIVEAYYRRPSTTDYSGVYRGRYIDFEAKETQQKMSFPLKNFHRHQIQHMKAVARQDGIAFVLMHFATIDETYYLDATAVTDFYDAHDGKKSMPRTLIQALGYAIPTQQIPRIPYLDIINLQIGGE